MPWPKYNTLEETFHSLITRDKNGCWICSKAYGGSMGYGQFSFRGTKYYAHRVAWQLYKGQIPEYKQILHTCDVPACCNPEHLFVGEQRDNNEDMFNKGRMYIPSNPKLTIEQVKEIKKLLREGVPRILVAVKFDMGKTTIDSIATGNSWRNVE